jgi:hypothetical protein
LISYPVPWCWERLSKGVWRAVLFGWISRDSSGLSPSLSPPNILPQWTAQDANLIRVLISLHNTKYHTTTSFRLHTHNGWDDGK